MIEDDIIREVRSAREEYARSHGFSIRAMIADLAARDAAGDWPVVSLAAQRPQTSGMSTPARQPAETATPNS
jgi:hypothetical protein